MTTPAYNKAPKYSAPLKVGEEVTFKGQDAGTIIEIAASGDATTTTGTYYTPALRRK